LPKGIWGIDIPRNIVTRPFNNAEQNGYHKMSIDKFGKLMGLGRGMVALQFFLLLNIELKLSISNQNSRIQCFCNKIIYSKFLGEKANK